MIRRIVWDYNIEPENILDVLAGKLEKIGPFNLDRILTRLCERIEWYDILNILGLEFIRKNLTEDVVEAIRFPEIKERYRYARKVLSGKTVPATGWCDENRQRLKYTLLSNRWYRTL